MAVAGKHCTVISDSGKTARVKAFSPDCHTLENVKTVDIALKWHHPCTDEMCILIVQNALHVPSMTNNLMPPFLMREAGFVVNDTPEIHTEDPGIDNHTLWFPDQKARMPLQLNGIFSCFPTDKPSSQDIDNCDPSNVPHLSPKGGWDPHNSVHAENEAVTQSVYDCHTVISFLRLVCH